MTRRLPPAGHRRLGWAMAAAAVAALSIGLSTAAHADPTLGGWTITADANGVDIVIDNATGLAGVHPFTESDLPEAESDFATGPFGSTLASVFWPGAAGGNFGSLSAELPIPAQLQPLFAKTNDPVRASAQYPSGPQSSQYPAGGSNEAVEMNAHATSNGTTATAALGDMQVANIVGFGSVKGTSSSTASDKAAATSSSLLHNVSLLGGMIGIGSITSDAAATSDGHSSSGHATTHLSGVTVLGQPASIGTDGLVLPSNLSGTLGPIVGPVAQSLLNQTVAALGMTVTTLPSSETHNGTSDSATAGGVRLQLVPNPALTGELVSTVEQAVGSVPGLPPQFATVTTLPGLLDGASLAVTLGRATASADASPPFNSNFSPGGFFVPPAAATGSAATTSGTPASGGASTIISSGGSTPAPASEPSFAGAGSTPASTGASSPASQAILATPVDLSNPIRAAEVTLGLLAAAGAAFGLWRLARLLVPEDAGPECPLGQESP